jgi:hypothetical protein
MKKLMYLNGVRRLIEYNATPEDRRWIQARGYKAMKNVGLGFQSVAVLKEFSRLLLAGMQTKDAKTLVRLRKAVDEFTTLRGWFDDATFALLLAKKMQEMQEAKL